MYKKMYKCRLCKKNITEDIYAESFERLNIKMLNDGEFKKEKIHYCENNSIGILEFIGIKFE